jgi:hypothetical protein
VNVYELQRESLSLWCRMAGGMFPQLRKRARGVLANPEATEADLARVIREIHVAGGWPASMDKEARKSLNDLSDDALMTHVDLANVLGLRKEPLRSRLDRWRRANKGSKGWQEVTEPEPHQPKYVYRVGFVRNLLRDAMAEAAK